MITPKKIFTVLSQKERITLIGALIVCMVAGILNGLFLFYAKTTVIPDYGGTFREGLIGQPVFINPVIPINEIDRDISRLVFSSLADLSDSITYTEEGRIWNVRLKEGLTWHDGEPLTSDDVIFTINTIQDPDSRSPLYASFQGVAVERLSEREVQFVLQNSYAFFAKDHLRNLGIFSRHIFDGIPLQNFRILVDGLHPIGSGPYMVTNHTIDENKRTITSLSLDVYNEYYGDAPYISSIVLKFYKNKDELIAAYNNGDIDGFGLSTAEALTNELTIRHYTHFFKSPRYYAIFINQSLAPEALQNIDVRKALSESINRDRIIQEIFDSNATPLYGPTTMNKDIVINYDVTLLQGLDLHITIPEEPFLEKTANLIKEIWESHGAHVTLEITSLAEIQENVLKNNSYEMILFGNIVKESQDLFSFWHSSRRFYPDQNLALYQNATVDNLLEKYRKSFDEEERKICLKELGDIITADIPAIFLYSPDYIYIADPKVKGLDTAKPINIASDRFSDIGSWYIKTKRVFISPSDPTYQKTSNTEKLPDEYSDQIEQAIKTSNTVSSTANNNSELNKNQH
ncbi:MAG: ABC transporter substrate-binding protein [bacterium]